MNIAISFVGEGLGHASRIITIAKELSKHHIIYFYCPKEVQTSVQEAFSLDKKRFSFTSIPHIELAKRDNKLQLLKTSAINFEKLFFNTKTINSLAKSLQKENIHAVISDYDRFLPLAGKKANIPVLLFNHQKVIEQFPKFSLTYFIAKVTNKIMMPHYDQIISSSFYDGDVGPIIRKEVKQLKTSNKNFILVYLRPFFRSQIQPILNKSTIPLKYFPNKNDDFLKALSQCKGIIAPAGHQLISEALYLKKPILVIPLKHHYEQQLNSLMLKESNKGICCDIHSFESYLDDFYQLIDKPSTNKSKIKFITTDDTPKAIKKIQEFLCKYVPSKL